MGKRVLQFWDARLLSILPQTAEVEDKDVGLIVTFIPDGSPPGSSECVHIQELIRISSESNAFRCPCGGTLQIVLDNSYSMLRGKRVRLTLTVIPPDAAASSTLHTTWDCRNVALTNEQALLGAVMFFNNDFAGAEAHFDRERNRFPLYALGHASLAFMRAVMTFGKPEMDEAAARLEHAKKLSARFMPKESMWSSMFGSGSTMTDLELEATVVNAETQLLTAVLYLLEESKIGLIKSAMTVRSGWKLYERADASIGGYVSSVRAADGSLGMRGGVGPASSDQMMMIGDEDDDAVLDDSVAESAEASPTVTEAATGEGATGGAGGTSVPAAPPSVQSNVHPSVLGGVLFGVGSFNILLSTLPPLILRIVKALGFPHNQGVGLEQLRQCFQGGGVRSLLAATVLIGVHIALPWAKPAKHIVEAQLVLDDVLKICPNSGIFLWMAGRLRRLQRNLSWNLLRWGYRLTFERCQAAVVGTHWVQLQQLCAYDIGWCRYFQLDYAAAAPLFQSLQDDNSWSKAFYAYMVATAYVELRRLPEAEAKFREIAALITRKLGGKSIPPEQYALRRATEYLTEVDASADPLLALVLPGLEHTYFFYGFKQMDARSLNAALQTCDEFLGVATLATAAAVTTEPAPASGADLVPAVDAAATVAGLDAAVEAQRLLPRIGALAVDRVAICAMIKGAILSNLDNIPAAVACYEWIVARDKTIVRERHTVPYALHDLGILFGGAKGLEYLKRSVSVKEDHNYKLRLHTLTHLATSELLKEGP